jgi:hypothetical protein
VKKARQTGVQQAAGATKESQEYIATRNQHLVTTVRDIYSA